jgi:hypothetical protein
VVESQTPEHFLDSDPLNFVQCDFIARPVVQLRRAWRFMSRDRLGLLNRAAIFKVRRDASCPKSVAACA